MGSLDDPLEKYVDSFTIKNPLGKSKDSELKYVTDGLIFLDSGEVQIRSSSVTLRRMASQLSGSYLNFLFFDFHSIINKLVPNLVKRAMLWLCTIASMKNNSSFCSQHVSDRQVIVSVSLNPVSLNSLIWWWTKARNKKSAIFFVVK